MKKKLSLELEALAVDSFATSAGAAGRGTVRGRESDDPIEAGGGGCTCDESCLCPTNAYYCATVQETVISCDYTVNGSCHLTDVTCGGISCNRCTD